MAAPKKVLVSNDDGIAADGLLAITRAVCVVHIVDCFLLW